jgi:hypothetical protein
MRKILCFITPLFFLIACSDNGTGKTEGEHDHHKATTEAPKDSSKKSIPSSATALVGNTRININYYAPAVRGRVIWGGLVPYDAVWVTGAHQATSLEVDKEFKVEGTTIPAGKYALFTIPGKDEWTVIINKNWNQHLADDYSQSDDLVRVKVKPETISEQAERLKYDIEQGGTNTARIIISWEKIRIPFQVEVMN